MTFIKDQTVKINSPEVIGEGSIVNGVVNSVEKIWAVKIIKTAPESKCQFGYVPDGKFTILKISEKYLTSE